MSLSPLSKQQLSTDQLTRIASTIRGLVIDAIEIPQSGHPGAPMGLADVATVLFWDVMRYAPSAPDWPARDRFVLSNGHASMLLYACLHLAGYDISLDDLKQFRQLGSKTPGHPEFGVCPGVETTTGPLGQGFAAGVGMALGQRLLAGKLPPDAHSFSPATGRVFVVCSDGDLMEGIVSESLQLAGAWELGNFVAIYDNNGVTIDGNTDLAWVENVRQRFAANQWRVIDAPGHDLPELRNVLATVAQDADDPENRRPTLVNTSTTIGFGSSRAVLIAHYGSFGDEIRAIKLGLSLDPELAFEVPPSVVDTTHAFASEKCEQYDVWCREFADWCERNKEAARQWDMHYPSQQTESGDRKNTGSPQSSPAASGETFRSPAEHCSDALNALAPAHPRLVGGSADLAESNGSRILDAGFLRDGTGLHWASARNIHFGVREHGGAGIINGLTLHGGFRGFLASFLVFSDYCRPSIRLASLMRIPSIFYFTHDSVLIGPDGPTHQPIEHLWSLRLIPNIRVFRPADRLEADAAWDAAIKSPIPSGPVVIAASTTPFPHLKRADDFDCEVIHRGGYVFSEDDDAQLTLCATGSEVSLAVQVRESLAELGIPVRIASLPCLEIFNRQPREYQHQVLRGGDDIPIVTLEAGVTEPWRGYLLPNDLTIGVDEFGASASWADVAPRFGLTSDQVVGRIREYFGF